MTPLADVLARLQTRGLLAQPSPETDLVVSGVCDDSRRVEPGNLYCAIRGHVHDGHRFLREAAEAGAVAALVEAPDPGVDLPQFEVGDSRRAAAVAAQVVLGDPTAGLALVGVTGTNGKTTTVHLARHLICPARPCGSIGTLGVVSVSGDRSPTGLTTPGPIELASHLAWLAGQGARCVVAEASSHALSQGRVDGAEFDIAAFTNLSRDHLDYHMSYEEYRTAKLRLATLLKPGGTVIANADEPAWSELLERDDAIGFGIDRDADYMARDVELGAWGSRWTLATPDGSVAVSLPLLGDFNVSNALAAVAIAAALGVGEREVAAALATAPPVPGRLEVVSEDPLVLRDYAHTPDALRRALQALRPLVSGRLIVVFGCGGDRDAGKRPLMGQAAAENADYVIVTSDNPRTEPAESIIDDILPGLTGAEFEREVDRRTAIARSLEYAGPGDTVLLAGKGHEDYQVVGEERIPFDEAVIVRELLGRSAEAS